MKFTEENANRLWLEPIGRVSSDIKVPMLAADDSGLTCQEKNDQVKEYHRRVMAAVCEIEIFPRWAELLEGIQGFSHILVLYWPHLLDPERRNLRRVHPMGRKDLPRQGIFATCSPARPNPVLVSAVPLLECRRNLLKVKGLEAVDGSPVIDIKPYVSPYYGAEGPRVPSWMRQIHEELGIDDLNG